MQYATSGGGFSGSSERTGKDGSGAPQWRIPNGEPLNNLKAYRSWFLRCQISALKNGGFIGRFRVHDL
jgi:hypothetical protein